MRLNITESVCRFALFPERYTHFHDRIRGVAYRRPTVPGSLALPHRYMRTLRGQVPKRFIERVPEQYR